MEAHESLIKDYQKMCYVIMNRDDKGRRFWTGSSWSPYIIDAFFIAIEDVHSVDLVPDLGSSIPLLVYKLSLKYGDVGLFIVSVLHDDYYQQKF